VSAKIVSLYNGVEEEDRNETSRVGSNGWWNRIDTGWNSVRLNRVRKASGVKESRSERAIFQEMGRILRIVGSVFIVLGIFGLVISR
jgi:hypothetical protein